MIAVLKFYCCKNNYCLTLSYRKSACVVFHLKYLLVKTAVWCAYVELVEDVKIFAYILLAIYYTKFI